VTAIGSQRVYADPIPDDLATPMLARGWSWTDNDHEVIVERQGVRVGHVWCSDPALGKPREWWVKAPLRSARVVGSRDAGLRVLLDGAAEQVTR
jgi:hypothetical protein